MESLAYIHQAIAYIDPNPAPIVTLWQRFNGQKRPSSGWLKFLGMSIVIAAAISLSEAAQAATVRVTTRSSNLNVRVQPNTNLSPIDSLAPGTLVEVADSNIPGWYVITAGNLRNNYIASEYTTYIGTGGDPIISRATGYISAGGDPIISRATGRVQVKTDNGLGINVREAPNRDSQIKGGFDEGDIISVVASDIPDWSLVTEGRYTGRFVNNSWLVSLGTVGNGIIRENSLRNLAVETNSNTERNYVIKTPSGRGIKVRSLPIETSQQIRDGLDEGARFTAKESGTIGWLQITSGNFRGGYIPDRWAVAQVVDSPRVSNSVSSSEASNYRIKTNSGDGVFVRSSPTLNSRNIGGLIEGSVVRAVPINNEWLQIISGEHSGGYIARRWTDDRGAIAVMNSRTGNYFVNTNVSTLSVRSAPRDTAGTVAELSRGQLISAVASGTSGWLRITEGPYAGGFISRNWVAPAS